MLQKQTTTWTVKFVLVLLNASLYRYRRVAYLFYHGQDCCESVRIGDIVGDLNDLLFSPILRAEETTDGYNVAPENADSYTWTFYTFTTRKGTVTVKWLGESNGYYSEGVDFRVINPNDAYQC